MRSPEPGTLLQSLLDSASQHPDQAMVRCADETLTYGSAAGRIGSTAGRLRNLGVRPGDRVLVSSPNHLTVPILYFAIHAIGAIAVPVPPETPELTLAAIARNCEARLAVLHRPASAFPCPVFELIAVAADGAEDVAPVCRAADVADILYTTGTTGTKKGVVLTHANIFAAARNMTEFIGTSPMDIEVVPLPLSHSFGLGRLRSLALVGHTIVLENGVGNGAPVIRSLTAHRATGLAMVPTGFEILRRITGDALARAQSHLRYVEIGSAPLSAETRDWLRRMLPSTRICHHYGLTEASRAAFTEYHSDAAKPSSAGRPSPRVKIAICDESLAPLPAGVPGEIVVAGEMVMREYWRQPELTTQAFCEHGIRTGDLGYLDADGYLFLLGRRGDVINVGGRKVVPDEVEEELRRIPGIQDAACVGADDELLGQHVKAFLVADSSLDLAAVAKFLRPHLEEYKIPKAIAFRNALPRTTSGKLQRNLLREPSSAEGAA